MAFSLVPLAPHLVRQALTIVEAQHLMGVGRLSLANQQKLSLDHRIKVGHSARQLLALALFNDDISGFLWSPSNNWYRIPKEYWREGMAIEDVVSRAAIRDPFEAGGGLVDAPHDIEGQPVILWRDEVERFIEAAGLDLSAELAGADSVATQMATGMAGRPTSKALIIEEMKKRAANGSLRETLKDECQDLLKWLREVHPKEAQPGQGATENAVRKEYWNLKNP